MPLVNFKKLVLLLPPTGHLSLAKTKEGTRKEKKQKKYSCIPKSFAVACVDFIPAIERITNYYTPALIVAIVNLRSQVPCLFKMLETLFAAKWLTI